MKVFCSKCAKSITVEPGTSSTVKCPDCSTEIPRPESDLSPGAVIGDFVIEKSLSKGGMGEVFLAKQISLDRPVALKILQKEFTNDRDYVASLFREARAAARINHPNVIQAYAVGNEGDNYYFAMELVRGDTLKNILRKEGALAPERAAKIILEISNAIGVAWRDQKLVHQDIKPDNIMLDVNGFSKLADLGLAKIGSMEQRIDDDSDEVLGTPQYISPEQLTGVPTDVRSDIYSLGATFYHIITGKLPYRASDVNQLAQMHNEGKLTPPKEVNADVPEELNRIIVKMMARDIQSRYQTPEELSADLKEFLEGNHEAAAKSGVKKLTAPKLVIPGKAKEGALKVSLPKSAPAADNKDADIELSAPKPAVPKPVVPPTAIQPVAPKATVPQPAVPRPVVPPAAPKAAVPKPVVPQPAVPQPAVPKPAVPQPVVPPTAGQPAIPQPETPPAAAPQNKAGAVKTGNGKGKKIALISGVILLALIVIGAVAVFSLEKSGILPPMITPYLDFAAEGADADGEAEDVAKNDASGDESKPAPVFEDTETSTYEEFAPVGRKEYISAVNELLEWRKNNSSADMVFLTKMDNVWSILQYPISPVEEEAFAQVAHFFSATDEELRCNNSRRELQQAHMTALIEAKRVADEQRRQEQQAAEDRRQNQQELARQEQENTRLRQEADREQKRRFEKMRQEILLMITTCMVEMRSAALTGNDAAMKEAIAKAQMYISTTPAFNNQEKQLMQQFKFIIAALPREKNNLQKIFAEFAKINAKSNVRIVLERGSASLLEFKPGELIYRGRGNEKISLKYDAMIPRTRTSLFISMEHVLKMKNCEFYSDLYHGKIPADSTVPAGFWKQIWPFAKQAL